MRAIEQPPRRWAIGIATAVAALAGPAAAQGVVIQADGSVNLGYTQTTRSAVALDPNADPVDVPDNSISNFFTEVRPGVSLQTASPRLSWRAAYLFSGAFSLVGGQGVAYSNQANLTLAAQLTQATVVNANASVAQGGTTFLQSQQPAEMGQPEIRAPGNPGMLTATLGESLGWQLGRHLSLQHSLGGSVSAQQDDLSKRNSTVLASLALERLYARDVFALEVRANVSRLSPLQSDQSPYTSLTNSLLGRWNHDFTWQWNALVTAGIEQVFTDTGSKPVALLPTGGVTVLYTVGNVVGGLDFNHGTTTNLQVGTVSLTDRATARAGITLDVEKARVLGVSAGFLHNEPLGEASALVAAGTGNAVQADAGFSTALNQKKTIMANVRYSLAYQYGQQGGLAPSLAHILSIGVTGSYTNTSKAVRPVPTRGRRVDGSDAKGFSTEPPTEDVTDPTAPTP